MSTVGSQPYDMTKRPLNNEWPFVLSDEEGELIYLFTSGRRGRDRGNDR
ncbi:hypothetical protein BH20ACI3_BH20ACI3_17630 [soil metagenome]